MNQTLPFPGATGLTHLQVYDSAAPDGLRGGSPHLHFVCTEAYYVMGGQGAVQTLDAGGYRETPLERGQVVWFSPGVIHRLVNLDGQLEILVVMQNVGLPEAGDFVMTFPQEILSDRTSYSQHAALGASRAVFATGGPAAQQRRDLAVEGFLQLRSRFDRIGKQALKEFYAQSLQIVRPNISRWQATWESGPRLAAEETGEQLDCLQSGDIAHLFAGRLESLPMAEERKLGMCGTLGTYLPEGRKVPASL
jgi:mannose-6-phosphate isomerase-like protein (cupin superfamily)